MLIAHGFDFIIRECGVIHFTGWTTNLLCAVRRAAHSRTSRSAYRCVAVHNVRLNSCLGLLEDFVLEIDHPELLEGWSGRRGFRID